MLLYLDLEACISSDASLNCTEAMVYSLITQQGIQYNVKQTSRLTGICMHVGSLFLDPTIDTATRNEVINAIFFFFLKDEKISSFCVLDACVLDPQKGKRW